MTLNIFIKSNSIVVYVADVKTLSQRSNVYRHQRDKKKLHSKRMESGRM